MRRDQYKISKRKAMDFPGPGNYEYLSDFPKRIGKLNKLSRSGKGRSSKSNKRGSRMSKTSRASKKEGISKNEGGNPTLYERPK